MAVCPEISSPQPNRPLKRKISQLYAAEDGKKTLDRLRPLELFPLTPQSGLEDWIEATLSPYDRRRSCPYTSLSCTEARTHLSRSDSFLDPILKRIKTTKMARFPTPDTDTNRAKNLSSTGSAGSGGGSRNKHPLYREDCLEAHNIFIDPLGDTLTAPIQDLIRDVIQKERDTCLSDAEVEVRRRIVFSMASLTEEKVKACFQLLCPASADEGGDFAELYADGGTVFSTTHMPPAPDPEAAPVVAPKPDRHFGYMMAAFETPVIDTDGQTVSVRHIVTNGLVSGYARPSTTNLWPFFFVEFKTGSRGGTHWVAQNQNAGSGALSVNSLEIIMARANVKFSADDAAVFSCSMDAEYATLWVSWHDEIKFRMTVFATYILRRPQDLRDMDRDIRNIIDYGLGKRLTLIRNTLAKLGPWLEKNKPVPKANAGSECSEQPPSKKTRTEL